MYQIILVSLVYLDCVWSMSCGMYMEDICCADNCPFCGLCYGNTYNTTNNTYIGNLDQNCCVENIRVRNITCIDQTSIPCINYDNKTDIDRVIDFFRHGQLYIVIPVAVLLVIAALFILYCWFWFGSQRKPPLPYAHLDMPKNYVFDNDI